MMDRNFLLVNQCQVNTLCCPNGVQWSTVTSWRSHFVQSSKPPFRITYRSALVTEIQGTDSNLKINVITNIPKIGVTQKQVNYDELENLHKLVYDTCRYSSEESIDRARRRLMLKEKCYHALYNNSHFFVTWCKTSREYPLTDILEQINEGKTGSISKAV